MTAGEVIREAQPGPLVKVQELLWALVSYPLTCWRNREIVTNFYARELRARFRGTLLGFAWPFLMPLVLFFVYYFVFAELFGAKFGIPDLPGAEGEITGKRWFTVYLFVGVIVWSGFAEALTRNCTVILENANLIKKISFPSEIFPLNVILVSVTIQAIAIVAYLTVSPFLGWNPSSWRLLALPALFAAQIFLSLGLSLAFAAINVFLRDTLPILGIGLTLWQFMTPVFWSRQALPAVEEYAWLLKWNPMAYLVDGYRKVLVNPGLPQYKALDAAQSFPTAEWPWKEVGIVCAASAVLFVAGYAIFYSCKGKFADEL
jgi:ABC-type polysaccharide/polyol phosphate export permease